MKIGSAQEPKPTSVSKETVRFIQLTGVTIQQLSKSGPVGVALDAVKAFDKALTGNDVIVFGYPSSIGLKNLPQIDYERPLLRRGIVAGTNASTRSIILDCPVYPGNSGGPVLEEDSNGLVKSLKVIGVVIQYVPFSQVAGSETLAVQILSNSGYSVVAPMDFVLELIK